MGQGGVKRFILCLLLLGLIPLCNPTGCSPSGTSSPPAPLAEMPTGLSQKIDAAGDALVPDVPGSSSSSLVVPSQQAALTYGTADQWGTYTQPGSLFLLTDTFGPAEGGLGPAKRIRVVLYELKLIIDDILRVDPEFTCPSADFSLPFSGGDAVEIAFYGSIGNGTADNRFLDCIRETTITRENQSIDVTTLYGLDANGGVRVVTQSDTTGTNTEDVANRGTQSRGHKVIWAVYDEQLESGATVGYLDIQYASWTSYSGPDEIFATGDDGLLKTRTRITGQVTFDASNNADDAVGDFTVTSSEQVANSPPSATRITNKNLGRGSYAPTDDFLFRIEVGGITEVAGSASFYCLEATDPNSGGVPLYIAPSNCSGFETSFAWGAAEFPFELPPLETVFENRSFFQEADLINDSGSNFTIPNY